MTEQQEPERPTEFNKEFRTKVYQHVQKYAAPSLARTVFETLLTFLIFYSCLFVGWLDWPPLAIRIVSVLIAGLARMRVFIIFHDVAHGSSIPLSHPLNLPVGTALGTVCLTPYFWWQSGHNYHHRHSNNLDKKQYAQSCPWTSSQLRSVPLWQKIVYVLVFGKFTLLSLSHFLYFTIGQRFFAKWYENALIVAEWSALAYFFGTRIIVLELITAYIGSFCGFFLFHSQHTFHNVYKRNEADWHPFDNGLRGSSFLQVPRPLKFFTYGIEYHHVHHINALVPGYRLQQCHEAAGEMFDMVPRTTLSSSIEMLKYNVYNEKLQSFEELYFD
eukprot:gnl/Spiro4/14006_TR7508_c0_g1_i1.p1 gnl/Spiro4/14006_TR7508_c0_g1~~gnl/Spiro4/14006_TR7508_c0_g1_i1.p1  ORF type:complete len:330 (+),score=61.88 gnl/Spiro4/14006_TR7508_c0_g1_i1:47-1036(+)